jgi:hypothetical protein
VRLLPLLLLAAAWAEEPLMRPLADQMHGEGDFGCILETGKKRWMSVGIDGEAMANLGGGDVPLKRVGEPGHVEYRVGAHWFERYRGGGYNVRIDFRVTRTCGHGIPDEDCEVSDVRAVITASDGKRQQKVTATGYCGT